MDGRCGFGGGKLSKFRARSCVAAEPVQRQTGAAREGFAPAALFCADVHPVPSFAAEVVSFQLSSPSQLLGDAGLEAGHERDLFSAARGR